MIRRRAERLGVVRKRGFEPPQGCPCQPLKLVRLPVSPLPRLAAAQDNERLLRIHRDRAQRAGRSHGAGFGAGAAGASAAGLSAFSAPGAAGSFPTSSNGAAGGAGAFSFTAPPSHRPAPRRPPLEASVQHLSSTTD